MATTVAEWKKQGCEACRHGVLSGFYNPEAAERQSQPVEPPEFVTTNIDEQADVHRCDLCGAWWRFNEREAHVIGEAEAQRLISLA